MTTRTIIFTVCYAKHETVSRFQCLPVFVRIELRSHHPCVDETVKHYRQPDDIHCALCIIFTRDFVGLGFSLVAATSRNEFFRNSSEVGGCCTYTHRLLYIHTSAVVRTSSAKPFPYKLMKKFIRYNKQMMNMKNYDMILW